MKPNAATAVAHPNLALIKYWGNLDDRLRIPANGSLSLTLGDFTTRTHVTWDSGQSDDRLVVNDVPATGPALERARAVLDAIRTLAKTSARASASSRNSFPTGAGLASSASGFAALAVAAAAAAGLDLSESDLSRIARRGSGSACRSISGGFVEWLPGTEDRSSYAVRIAGPEHWSLADLVAVIDPSHKTIGSTEGHRAARTSPLQEARLRDAPRRLDECREAVLQKDFERLADVVEYDSNLLHAVMATSQPPLLYLQETTNAVLQRCQDWRQSGLPVCYSVDAGPNVHLLTPSSSADAVYARLREIPGVREVLRSSPGGSARVVSEGAGLTG